MMYVVYILKSNKDGNLYVGRTSNLKRRLSEHNSGQVSSTKSRRPLILMNYIVCKSERESIRLEREYKKGYQREKLKKKYK